MEPEFKGNRPPQICENCQYFRQHYVKHGRSYLPTADGHCVYPRIKSRTRETKSCQHFKSKTEPAQ